MSERKVFIKVFNLDRGSYVDKCTRCDVCLYGTKDRNMENCPLIKYIANNITQTSYNIKDSTLNITTATYDHDFRRALDVVNHAIGARCFQRQG